MSNQAEYGWRLLILILVLFVALFGLVSRIVYLGIIKRDFLINQSKIRSVREIGIPAHRGIINDRNGKPLAISVKAASVWVNPKLFDADVLEEKKLAKLSGVSLKSIKNKVAAKKNRSFVYLKRSLPLKKAEEVLALKIKGIFLEKGYRRYYPEAEVAAHVVGFTDIDDRGQEGLELAYDSWLKGIPGKTRIVKDRLGNRIANLEVTAKPKEGSNLTLSIDKRIQYLAYKELKNVVKKYHAESGSVVVLAVKTGEVLAMVNMPSYNPNDRRKIVVSSIRNRAVTDLFEPGSTMKTFSVVNALNSDKYHPNTLVDTNPGKLKIDDHLVRDDGGRNNGILTVTGVLKKSSNVGVAKMTLSLPSDSLLNLLRDLGFGQSTQSGFPGEATGVLPNYLKWRPFVLATLSFGYSLSVTPLQLAQAYAVIASKGLLRPITFLRNNEEAPGKRVLSEKVCRQMLKMLGAVVSKDGASQAMISGYRVAGKTGTARIASPSGGYYKDRHFSDFIGIAPVSDPELVVVVVIKDPKGKYYGGQVAAPLFAKVMGGALRILGVPLDDGVRM